MKIYVVKHYWKNGENATWQKHEKINNELFEYLKDNYHNFVKNRKSSDKFKNYYIQLCYQDTKDVYNRDITNITFYISTNQIPINLCNKKVDNMEINYHNKSSKKYIIPIIALIAMVTIGLLFMNSTSNNNNEKTKPTKIINHNYEAFINNWNHFAQNITSKKSYLLSRSSNKKVIEQLNRLKRSFYKIDQTILDDMKRKNANRYEKFLTENQCDKNITFSTSMDSLELKKNLKILTKESDLANIVKKVLMMNDKDIFLEKEKNEN